MKTVMVALALVMVLSGCRSHDVVVRIVEKTSGNPVKEVLVERYQPASWLGKIINPVGTTYHPLTMAEMHLTNIDGTCKIKEIKNEEVFG